MCGIAGIVSLDGAPELRTVRRMLDTQRHRGPDFSDALQLGHACLGHNRLSIIDLREASNQPFTDGSGRYTLTFNGEIYNYLELRAELASTGYAFRTEGDVEVLLAAYLAWGADCLERLNGMFAFAIYDAEERRLFAARDRFGVKPLAYAQRDGSLAFASEIKALWAAGVPRSPDEATWAGYLAYGSYGAPDRTFWAGIRQLPAGHALTWSVDDPRARISRWYDFAARVAQTPVYDDKERLVAAYEELLADSIRLRFRADVPVGFNVSGGLDSSALLALVARYHPGDPLTAYSFYTGDDRYDELPWVRRLVAHTDSPLSPVLVTADEIPGLEAEVSAVQDEPYGGIPTLAYAQTFARARADRRIVLLDGQGMDEQWAGYDYYRRGHGQASTIQGTTASPFRPGVLDARVAELARAPRYPTPFGDWLLDTQYRDLFYTKIPRALRFNDRISMRSSTELREPFLDYRLVELAFAQRRAFKIEGDVSKVVLRDIVAKELGADLAFAPKRPLQTPQREWLRGPLRGWVGEHLDRLFGGPAAAWFDEAAVRREWRAYLEGGVDSSFHVWQWVSVARYVNAESPATVTQSSALA